jgi:hypothetical protein
MLRISSLGLIAVGALLCWAIHVRSSVISLTTIGVILMLTGGLLLLLRLTMRPPVDPRRPLNQADMVAVEEVVVPGAGPEQVIVDRPEQVVVDRGIDARGALIGETDPPSETTPVVRHHYAGDPDDPTIYSITGRPVRQRGWGRRRGVVWPTRSRASRL